jgi:hypothetical protein
LLLVDDAQRALAILADIDRGVPVDNLIALAASGAPLAIVLPKGGAHRLSTHAVAFLVLTSGDPVDDAAWSMPRGLHGLVPRPGRARFGTAGLWCECQVGRASTAVDEPLVASLPSAIAPESLPRGSGLQIGIGGDDAVPVAIDPMLPILVIGPPGAAREAAERSLGGSAADQGISLDLRTMESPIAASRGLPAGATVILTDPMERTAREVYRGDLEGLIDPRPPMCRVLIVVDGRAIAAQLVDPREGRGGQSCPAGGL